MNQETEQGVRKAMDQFQSFCLMQIVVAWFADAPDPAALVDQMLSKWGAITRTGYEKAGRRHAEATGIISDDGQWLDDVLAEAQKRIRVSLAKQIGDQRVVLQPVCVREKDDHDCELDSPSCVFDLHRSRKVN